MAHTLPILAAAVWAMLLTWSLTSWITASWAMGFIAALDAPCGPRSVKSCAWCAVASCVSHLPVAPPGSAFTAAFCGHTAPCSRGVDRAIARGAAAPLTARRDGTRSGKAHGSGLSLPHAAEQRGTSPRSAPSCPTPAKFFLPPLTTFRAQLRSAPRSA